jgi:Flp pilus assembly secretin CpaC
MLRAVGLSFVVLIVSVSRLTAQEVVGVASPSSLPHQVQLQFRLLSLDRTALGRNPVEIDNAGRLVRLEQTFDPNRLQVGNGAAAAMSIDLVTDEPGLERLITEWRDRAEVLTILAEPTLVTLNGQEAEFHSGGWLDVPVPQAGGTFKNERWRLGLICDCRPVVLDANRLRLEIACRYRRTDPNRGVTINQVRVPTIYHDFDVNLASQVESGQLHVIHGLLQKRIVDGRLVETESLLLYKAVIVPTTVGRP